MGGGCGFLTLFISTKPLSAMNIIFKDLPSMFLGGLWVFNPAHVYEAFWNPPQPRPKPHWPLALPCGPRGSRRPRRGPCAAPRRGAGPERSEAAASWSVWEETVRSDPTWKRNTPLGVDSFSILFNRRSFQKPGVFPGIPEVF